MARAKTTIVFLALACVALVTPVELALRGGVEQTSLVCLILGFLGFASGLFVNWRAFIWVEKTLKTSNKPYQPKELPFFGIGYR